MYLAKAKLSISCLPPLVKHKKDKKGPAAVLQGTGKTTFAVNRKPQQRLTDSAEHAMMRALYLTRKGEIP